MKKLNELIDCDIDVEVNGIKINSRDVLVGDIFVCTDMGTQDRHLYIDDAIARGASCIIAKKDVGKKKVPVLVVDNPNDILPVLASKFYDEPEKKLKLIGVTGTDGKTSVATIMQTLISDEKCGYIGTNGCGCEKFNLETANSTPDSDKLYMYFDQFVKSGCEYCSMEVSSEALMRKRVKNLEYDISILTNITSEHLNIHGSLENYIASKCQLFKQTKKDGYCILNADDSNFDVVKKYANGNVLTYGQKENSDLYFFNINLLPKCTSFDFIYKDITYHVNSPYPGLFNVYNLSACILALFALGYNYGQIEERIPLIKVDGRLEMVDMGQDFYVMVDYAHTANGVKQLLNYAKVLPVNRRIVVTGQAGERDTSKRKYVGQEVVQGSDYVIFTYEDPRSEDPLDIINMMLENVKEYNNYEIVVDRALAIKRAIEIAETNDIVMILGKGNENYELLKDGPIHFNDIEEVKKCIQERIIVEV